MRDGCGALLGDPQKFDELRVGCRALWTVPDSTQATRAAV